MGDLDGMTWFAEAAEGLRPGLGRSPSEQTSQRQVRGHSDVAGPYRQAVDGADSWPTLRIRLVQK